MFFKFSRFLLIVSLLIAGIVISGPSRAYFGEMGEKALLNIIGYSEDGRYFSFEEYGIQDGSGFAYSSIYIIDLSDDSWVVGTPIRVIDKEMDETSEAVTLLANARSEAHEKAQLRLDGLAMNRPAMILAYNGDGELDSDGLSLRFGVARHGMNPSLSDYMLNLESFNAQTALSCVEWFSKPAVGFLLKLVNAQSGIEEEIYRDKVLSRSRGCASSYKISGIYIPYEASDISDAVTLISVFGRGFEGAIDRRYIVVPIGKGLNGEELNVKP